MVSYEAHFYNVYTKQTMELNELKRGVLSANIQESDLSNLVSQQQMQWKWDQAKCKKPQTHAPQE